MDINKTAETILRWINSCANTDQLKLCYEVIDTFMAKRFKDHPEVQQNVDDLNMVVNTRIGLF